MKKAIIVGASSGIGRELAKVLVRNEYLVAVVGRRQELLNAVEQIYQAINRKKKHAYVTKRWRLIAWLLKLKS